MASEDLNSQVAALEREVMSREEALETVLDLALKELDKVGAAAKSEFMRSLKGEDLKRRVVNSGDDFGHKYRARLVKDTKTRRRWLIFGEKVTKSRWHYEIERHFIGWATYETSLGFKSRFLAKMAANARLDELGQNTKGEYV